MKNASRNGLAYFLSLVFSACAGPQFMNTAKDVNIQQFMGPWYVLAGRFTFLEKDPFNAVEKYTWNKEENRIDISFTFNQGSFDGKEKSIPQKGWIENSETNAHWIVSPFWPLKFDYLIVDLAEDYSWTAVGTPNQKYLWIMARDPKKAKEIIKEAVKRLNKKGYDSTIETFVLHQ